MNIMTISEAKQFATTKTKKLKTLVRYTCKKCNKETERYFFYYERDNGLCKSCLFSEAQKKKDWAAIKEKTKQTCLEKYGVEHVSQSDEVKEKINQTWIEKYGSLENYRKIQQEKSKKTCLEKYGVEHAFQLDEVKEKIKEVCLEKYGVEHASQADEVKEKTKQTCLEKYGVEYTLQSDEVKNKSKQTCMKKYGVEHASQCNEIKEKIKQTCLEKYGVEHASQSDEVKNKSKQTCMKKYGVEHASQSDEVKNKIKETCLEKYGTSWTNTKESREKSKQTCLEKYGECNYNNREKAKQTCLEKYGVEQASQAYKVKNKINQTWIEKYGSLENYRKMQQEKSKQTCLEKYGTESFFQTSGFSKYHRSKYVFKGLNFDSSWELAYYIYQKEHNTPIERNVDKFFEYNFLGKKHRYFPDFDIKGKMVEIKGSHFINEESVFCNPFDSSLDGLFAAKQQCALNNNVEIITNVEECLNFLDSKYGKTWKKIFRHNDEKMFGLSFEEVVEICENSEFPGDSKYYPKHIIWDCNVGYLKSPREAWADSFYIRKAVSNMFQILVKDIKEGKEPSFVEAHRKAFQEAINGNVINLTKKVLRRFTVAKIAPRVTAISKETVLEILKDVDVSKGIYCPMAGFGGIIEAAKCLNVPYEAYDINDNLCKTYGWKKRDCTKEKVITDKICVACPPFGKKYEHWKGTSREYSDLDFEKWCDIIKKMIKAPKYILIGPESQSRKGCGLFSKTKGVELYND